ncbi:MAG TPA: endospore germination permease [Oscillospiraceae bacterium]|nr:endospore germination permease [Oscillospiraceae bacterium]
MKLEKGEISNAQLAVLTIAFLQAMTLTINFNYAITKQGTWLAVLAGFVLALPIAVLYTAIARRFPGQNLIQINDAVFGPYAGKLISILYIWFFIQLTIHYMFFFNSFWITYIMPETPRVAFLVMFAFVCAMAVWSGIEVIARCSYLFSAVVAVTIVTVAVLLVKEIEPGNLLPIVDFSLKDFVQSVHVILTVPFCDLVVFLMILPYTAQKQKIRKPVLIGVSLSAAQLLIVAVVSAAVMGQRILNTSSVSFAVPRLIDVADILTRLDILVAIMFLITVFMKISIFYYVTVLSLAQFLRLRAYRPLVVPIGVLCTAVAVRLYPSDLEQVYAATFVWPFNAAVYEILLPILTFAVILVRRLPKKEEAVSP